MELSPSKKSDGSLSVGEQIHRQGQKLHTIRAERTLVILGSPNLAPATRAEKTLVAYFPKGRKDTLFYIYTRGITPTMHLTSFGSLLQVRPYLKITQDRDDFFSTPSRSPCRRSHRRTS
jgi:hypothetical protein